jgi:hypothetical protein
LTQIAPAKVYPISMPRAIAATARRKNIFRQYFNSLSFGRAGASRGCPKATAIDAEGRDREVRNAARAR